jgi:hypothetical protein
MAPRLGVARIALFMEIDIQVIIDEFGPHV